MKIRIKGNSLRFRVTQSELARLIGEGRIDETIYFSPSEDSRLTYVLEHQSSSSSTSLRYRPPEVAIVLSTADLRTWGESDQIVDPAYGDAYAAAIDGARFEVLPATGHMPQMESPDLVLQRIWS